ncbi:LysM peptidoglycan-binding domain-containing protein [Paenibacillus doosanensis]|uniref:LysM peptidoglycan-binding domain-containing protein n=1 Tax=Paenibacillus doosanensis TaxID=1229154 RepID=UPI0021807E8E|nr:LysM peptidoglycan-binding domain-containing protein [Paenibacillus doosanensis]MCS7463381.1 LysM peptidoglycan-binding domain-containing protein [Paenibacillus doosanensis]
MSNLSIWLKFNNEEESLQLPVNPESIRVSTTRGYDDVELTQLGETTFFGNEKLREYTLSSFFPSEYNLSYTEYNDKSRNRTPWDIVRLIEKWMSSRKPIRFTVTSLSPDPNDMAYLPLSTVSSDVINTPVTIRSFNYEERAGHVGDLFYELTLKEYRFIEFKRLTKPSSDDDSVLLAEDSPRPDDRSVPDTYEVQQGDTLWHIAKRLLGTGDRWQELYEMNQSVIGPNPSLIYPGQVLVIRE